MQRGAMMAFDKAKYALEKTRSALTDLESEIEQLRQAALGAESQCQAVNSLRFGYAFRESTGSWGTALPAERTVKDNLARLEEEWQRIEKEHAANLPVIENNKAIWQTVAALMRAIGIPDQYEVYEYPSSKSRTKKTVKKSAGWMQDLSQFCRTSDGYDAMQVHYKQAKAAIAEWQQKAAAKEREAQAQKAAEQKKQEAEQLRAVMVVKYGLDFKADMHEVLMAILDRNKYLRLAYWLERNRGDWNEGHFYADRGLDDFTCESDMDRAIVANLRHHIDEWDGDGRIFRDCEWNYGRIYELVNDATLVADFLAVRQHIRED